MLIQIDIENVAVIERASIEFDTGLNIITGETGAGKSLLLNSLNMALLNSFGISQDEDNVVITRKLYRDGRNLCHINGDAVNVTTLRSVGEKLVVIHGQHDSSDLFDTSSHIRFLDAFADLNEKLVEYRKVYGELKEVAATLSKLNEDAQSRQREIDYLTYQTDEIEKANLSLEEEEILLERKNILSSAETIKKYAEKAYLSLGGDSGAKDSLYDTKRALESLTNIDASILPFSEKATELYYEIEELSHDISSYMSGIEYNERELREIDDRLDEINTLKRKFGGEISDILKFYEEASEKLLFLKAFDENKDELVNKKNILTSKALDYAKEISNKRHESAVSLAEKLSEELSYLDMPKCRIEFSFTECELCENGIEKVEFLISTNPSEAPKSLAKIASGGEISRVMLAIKSVFSDFDKIPTLLFDEIDTGVSGRAAEKIANKMKTLSKKYQIISVTHLPVIAAAGNNHMLIEKKFYGDGFKTGINRLDTSERIREIARIISGDNINEISLENAAQMLEFSGGNN